MIFSSLPSHGIPPHSPPHPFSADFSWQPIIRQSRIPRFPSIESHHTFGGFPGFVTPGPALLTSAVVHCLRSASIVFVVVSPLRSTGHYCPISLLFHSSPSPLTGGPGDTNNTHCIEFLQKPRQVIRLDKWLSSFQLTLLELRA